MICTLSTFTARSIAEFITKTLGINNIKIFTSGGGAKNTYITNYLKEKFPGVAVADTSELGIDPDAKEAILFALLGNEALCDEPMKIGNNPAVLMGKFSFPG